MNTDTEIHLKCRYLKYKYCHFGIYTLKLNSVKFYCENVIKNVNSWTPSSDLHWSSGPLSVGCTGLWTACSAFDLLVCAISSRMQVTGSKSWMLLFPETSFVNLSITGCWHMADQVVTPWHYKKQSAARGRGFPRLHQGLGLALWDTRIAVHDRGHLKPSLTEFE